MAKQSLKFLLLVILVQCLVLAPRGAVARADSGTSREYQVKAAFL